MAAGPPRPPSASSSSSRPPGAPTPDGDLTFEFWNDRCYQGFRPEDTLVLSAKFRERPRPSKVPLGGGKYEVREFDNVEAGRAVQVNMHTQFERHVRLRPPYRLPGAPEAKLPDGPMHFSFEDDHHGWQPYSQWLQQELLQAARCAPPPAQMLFTEEGKGYVLYGLDSLMAGIAHAQLFQVNLRTQNMRRVQLAPGDPGHAGHAGRPGNGGHAAAGRSNGNLGNLFARTFGGGGGGGIGRAGSNSASSRHDPRGASGSFSNAAASSGGRPFTLGSAYFCAGPGRIHCGVPEKAPPLSADAHEALCRAWRSDPRPERVDLPNGDVVVGFQDLEVGGATLHCPAAHHLGPIPLPSMGRHGKSGGTTLPLELQLPMPQPGRILLPDSLDVDSSCSPMPFGRFLSNAEVTQLPSRGSEANKCSICLSEMEPDGDALDRDIPMAPVDNMTSNNNMQGAGIDDGPAFELQCGHAYHTECIKQWFRQRRRCPQCQRDFGKVVGDQPRIGSLSWHLEPFALPGHAAAQMIVIQFEFPPGTTEEGTPYEGRKPKGYLPGDAQGILLLELFKIAFRRCVMFGLGTSMSFGTFRPTFNIHIKTSTHRGTTGHGYPDDSYFKRALEELHANGVTLADLPE